MSTLNMVIAGNVFIDGNDLLNLLYTDPSLDTVRPLTQFHFQQTQK